MLFFILNKEEEVMFPNYMMEMINISQEEGEIYIQHQSTGG